MRKLDSTRFKALTPIELLIGFSAVARGLYLTTIAFTSQVAVVTTDSKMYNILVGLGFISSGLILIGATLHGGKKLRAVGLGLVLSETLFIVGRIFEQGTTTVSTYLGNVALVIVCLFLLAVLFVEKE